MNLREDALAIVQTALEAADPRTAIRRVLSREGNRLHVASRDVPVERLDIPPERLYDLSQIHRVFVIGFGKASAAMAQAVEDILGDRIKDGWVSVKYGHDVPLTMLHVHEAGHPLPDENSVTGALEILRRLDATTETDLVICLISGGGSAILELPVEGVSLDDIRVTTELLLRAGATINELNALRKHLSQVKGGQLARRARGRLVSLILSDVIGSPLDTIASGPTAPDSTTFPDALGVLERRGVRDRVPASVLSHLDKGLSGEIQDTPKANDPLFERVQNVIIADGEIACNAALRAAEERGYHSLLLSTYVQGEAREVARVLTAIAQEIAASNRPIPRPACVIAGGETTVTVRGNGKGGRNQELALAASLDIAGRRDTLVLSVGTDGTDGPTEAAGALADGTTLARAQAQGLDARAFLANNDAFHFFEPLGDLIITGPTNTNVNDIMLALVT